MISSPQSLPSQDPAQDPARRPKLELVFGNQRFACHDGDVIGREGSVATATLALTRTMSRQHLLVSWRGGSADDATPGTWSIRLAPKARNETRVDGHRLKMDVPHALGTGDHRVDVADFTFGLHVSERPAGRAGDPGIGSQSDHSGRGLEQLREQFGVDGLFHLLTDNARDLIAVIDEQGKRVWNNDAYFSCLGYRPEDIRRSYSMLELHPDDQPLVKQVFEESMRTGVGKRIEYRMRHRDEHWLYLESQGSVVQAPDGATKYLVLVARDITARKEAEQKAFLRARRLVERTTTLAKFTQSPEFQDGNLESCFAQVVTAAAEHFECERASVWLFSPDGRTLTCQDMFEETTLLHRRGDAWPAAACAQFLAELRVKRCLAIDNAFTDARLDELRPIYLFSHRISSLLAARICLGSEVLGILVLERTDVIEHWNLEDQNFAASLADLLLAALQARKRIESFAAMQESQRQLAAELAEAVHYVRALLPAPLAGEVESEWRFVPCTSLGGDGFGYQWLDERYLAVYLLDAVGHGVGAALLCISALNMLRSETLPRVDFHDPAAVLSALNRTFDMERQANMFFTVWYGVYDRKKRELTYSAAGHPPPVLLGPGGTAAPAAPVLLGCHGLMIGADADAVFITATTPIPLHARLYIFSDGVFEITRSDGNQWGFDQFTALLGSKLEPGVPELDALHQHVQKIYGNAELPDDFSVLRLVFH